MKINLPIMILEIKGIMWPFRGRQKMNISNKLHSGNITVIQDIKCMQDLLSLKSSFAFPVHVVWEKESPS